MKLVYYPDPILETVCREVTTADLDLDHVLLEMREIMFKHDGIGLAANQIGYPVRIFIMKDLKGKIWEFINPVITFKDDIQYEKEGCLSLPGVWVEVPRAKQVSIKAFNRNWEEFKVGCTGIEAICVQHEMEHLDGKFFIEAMSRQDRRRLIREAKKHVQKT